MLASAAALLVHACVHGRACAPRAALTKEEAEREAAYDAEDLPFGGALQVADKVLFKALKLRPVHVACPAYHMPPLHSVHNWSARPLVEGARIQPHGSAVCSDQLNRYVRALCGICAKADKQINAKGFAGPFPKLCSCKLSADRERNN